MNYDVLSVAIEVEIEKQWIKSVCEYMVIFRVTVLVFRVTVLVHENAWKDVSESDGTYVRSRLVSLQKNKSCT